MSKNILEVDTFIHIHLHYYVLISPLSIIQKLLRIYTISFYLSLDTFESQIKFDSFSLHSSNIHKDFLICKTINIKGYFINISSSFKIYRLYKKIHSKI